jgi:hypothetical protein
MKFSQFLQEAEKDKEKEKKIVFKETDGRSPFPENTVRAIEKEISGLARDLEQEWDNVAKLMDTAFENLDVPKPQAFQSERWKQYTDMIGHATNELYKSRGFKSTWSRSV